MGRRFWGLCLGAALIVLVGRTVVPFVYARLVLDQRLRTALEQHFSPDIYSLVERGADPNLVYCQWVNGNEPWHANSPLLHAAQIGDTERVANLLRRGALPNIDPKYGMDSPLTMAARWSRLDMVRMLLKAGADPNLATSPKSRVGLGHHTPLFGLAYSSGEHARPEQIACAKLLIEHGADVNRLCPYLTPGAFAERHGNKPLAAYLKSVGGRGLEACLKDIERAGPMAAVQSGETVVVKRLAAKGVWFDSELDRIETPLLWAAANRKPEMVECLLKYAPHRSPKWVDARSEYGSSPINSAILNHDDHSLKLLIAAGADVNAVNDSGRTPLTEAVAYYRPSVVPILLKAGADPDLKPVNGPTARQYARMNRADISAIFDAWPSKK